jgi:acetylglutamate kinase
VATGISGHDGNLFVAKAKDERLGFVGEIAEINPGLILSLLSEGYVPVVAPLARGTDGKTYNLNADTAAAALAAALGSCKLVYLTDVEGLYRDLGDHDSLVQRAIVPDLEAMVASGGVSAGMLPKLVERVHILDGRIQHSVLLEIFTADGIGTMITQQTEPVP